MDDTELQTTRRGAVLHLILHGPRTRNSISAQNYAAIQADIIAASDDPAVRAIVIAGSGGYFCSGGNVRNLGHSASQTMAEATRRTDALNAMIKALRASSKPIIAAVEGGAAGAGLALALACDLIVAGRSAQFMAAYVRIGLTPDGGTTHFLASLLPRQLVNEMCLLGDPVGAEVLSHHGVINRVVPDGAAVAEATALAERLSLGPSQAMGTIKQLIVAARETSLATQLEAEAAGINRARFGEEAREGIAAFLAKRPPDFGRDG